ncbi:MAG: molybdopterin molybdotransferase MoeA [Deltaproteobacteria bacterium]|nr:molybdopterin molybdotransferase MoeA [Deltaproteobacteria bacterium]
MITVAEAKKILDKQAQQMLSFLPKTGRILPLTEVVGRITAEPISAPISVPLFDNSAMDGFAVRSADVKTASPDCPVILKIDGEARAGDSLKELGEPQTTIRIMTGAPLPLNADAVVMKEEAVEKNGGVLLSRPVAAGKNVRRKGEDFNAGDEAIPVGTKITPGVAGLMASLGIRNVPVKPKPRVSVIATGCELVSCLEALKPGKILESNSVFLKAALSEIGISPVRNAVIEDDPALIRERLVAAFEDCHQVASDVIIITGGVSVGDHDHTRSVLEGLGVTQLFWKVAQKPGKPFYVGTLDKKGEKGEKLIFGLPGNPYAVFVCFYLYIHPILLTLMGHPHPEPRRERLKLSRGIAKNDGRSHFLKGKTVQKNNETLAWPLKGQGSHLLGALTKTDILICVPAETREIKEGEEVEVVYLP